MDEKQELRPAFLGFDYGKKLWRVGCRESSLMQKSCENAMRLCASKNADFQYRLFTTDRLKMLPFTGQNTVGAENDSSLPNEADIAELYSGERDFYSEFRVLLQALVNKDIDFFVEDLSKLPFKLGKNLQIAAVLPRGDARDVLVLPKNMDLDSLPSGAGAGVSGERRRVLLQKLRPDLVIRKLRSSADEMLRMVIKPELGCCVCSAAQLKLLDLKVYSNKLSFYPLAPQAFCPQPGAGMTAFINLKEDEIGRVELKKLAEDEKTRLFYQLESAAARKLLGRYSDNGEEAAAYAFEADGRVFFTCANIRSDKKYKGQISAALNLPGEKSVRYELLDAATDVLMGELSYCSAVAGRPDLLSEESSEKIKNADVLFYEERLGGQIISALPADAKKIVINVGGGKNGSEKNASEKLAAELADLVRCGNRVVRLVEGSVNLDPNAGRELLHVSSLGIKFKICASSSYELAAAEYTGFLTAVSGRNSGTIIVEGKKALEMLLNDKSCFRTLLSCGVSLIVSKASEQFPSLCRALANSCPEEYKEALLVSDPGLATQKIIRSCLDELPSLAVKNNISAPAFLMVGAGAAYGKAADWFPVNGILGGKVIVIGCGESEDAYLSKIADSAEKLGAGIVKLSLLSTGRDEFIEKRMDAEISKLLINKYSVRSGSGSRWLLFGGESAASALFDSLDRLNTDYRSLSDFKFAAMGRPARERLRKMGIKADFFTEDEDEEGFINKICELCRRDDTLIRIKAVEGGSVSNIVAKMHKISLIEIPAYSKRNTVPSREQLRGLFDESDFFIINGRSAARAFAMGLVRSGISPSFFENSGIKLIAAQEASAKVLESAGFWAYFKPEEYTVRGMMELLINIVLRGGS